jgi:NAD(P)-dependent dehydrogenase (short-subunit alcohol dehydrogenase family)
MNSNDPARRVVLLSGATGAIGKAIALQIAMKPEYELVLLCRDEHRARAAVRDIQQCAATENVTFELVDLSSQDSIHALSRRRQEPVHVLVNNAAVTPRRRGETCDGIELQFATNVLGYFWMIQALSDQLRAGAPSRVVNVASYWAGDLDLDDLEFRRRRYDNNRAYRQSKQADRMLTVAFARRLKDAGVAVNACHPGDVNSRLSNNLGFGGHESPQEAARTPAWLATASIGQQETGGYFEHLRRQHCQFAKDSEAVEALYAACLSYQ